VRRQHIFLFNIYKIKHMAKKKIKGKKAKVTTEEPTSETTVVISDITEVDGPNGVVEEPTTEEPTTEEPTTEEPTTEEPAVDTTIEGGGKKKSKKKSKKKR